MDSVNRTGSKKRPARHSFWGGGRAGLRLRRHCVVISGGTPPDRPELDLVPRVVVLTFLEADGVAILAEPGDEFEDRLTFQLSDPFPS